MDEDSGRHRENRLNWEQVKSVYWMELRSAFREKAIVLNTILIPIFLYPVIMWAGFTGLMFVQGQAERFVSRVAVADWPADHPGLQTRFDRNPRIQVVRAASPETATERLQSGTLDAVLEFLPAENAKSVSEGNLPGNFRAQITFNGSKDRSDTARKRVEAIMEGYRDDWLKREARNRGIDADAWRGIAIEMRNRASGRQMGGFVLGMVIPVLFVVMVAMGCFYPAVDATAGERERNTWETLMSTAANRVSIVTAKYLYVTTMGGLAGTLNVAAMALTMKPIFAPLLSKAGVSMSFVVPAASIPFIVLAAVLLAGFVSAGMMIFAAFARTFKEGQSMIMPFYLVILLPVMFLQVPGLKFSIGLALLPVVNVTMLVRSAISGAFPPASIAVTVLASLAMIAFAVRIAAAVVQSENVLMGTHSGGLKSYLKLKMGRFKQAAPASIPDEVRCAKENRDE